MRVVRTIQKENGDQKDAGAAEDSEDQRLTVQLAVVQAHEGQHGDEADDGVENLVAKEGRL